MRDLRANATYANRTKKKKFLNANNVKTRVPEPSLLSPVREMSGHLI